MGEVTIFREIFLVGEISKVLAVGWDFLLILKFFQRFEGRGKVHTWWEQQKKEGVSLVRRRIQVYNSGR